MARRKKKDDETVVVDEATAEETAEHETSEQAEEEAPEAEAPTEETDEDDDELDDEDLDGLDLDDGPVDVPVECNRCEVRTVRAMQVGNHKVEGGTLIGFIATAPGLDHDVNFVAHAITRGLASVAPVKS